MQSPAPSDGLRAVVDAEAVEAAVERLAGVAVRTPRTQPQMTRF
jgi:hypothetical protein